MFNKRKAAPAVTKRGLFPLKTGAEKPDLFKRDAPLLVTRAPVGVAANQPEAEQHYHYHVNPNIC
ncbi:MAG: hypothetical protein QGG08_03525, partial [Candidatus Poseidoniia archaeon]|nr:hypothetical protein [Candidatus Poseidoniia archaeon]